MPLFRRDIAAARQRLADGYERLLRRHRAGCPGIELSAATTDLRDEILRDLFEAALHDLGGPDPESLRCEIALVAHGGQGRRDLAPHSDVDLMMVHTVAARGRVTPLAARLFRDVFDAGLLLGHSIRTPDEAIAMASKDAVIASSLIESRLLVGSDDLFDHFVRAFHHHVGRQGPKLIAAIVTARREEQLRYGETVYLLEPNVKRSRGGLRELHLLRWIGFARYGTPDPDRLRSIQALSEEDVGAMRRGRAFLLRVRNEMHFHAGEPADVIHRAEQLRIAEQFGYASAPGVSPAERFMQDYFRHTGRISHIADRFVANARSKDRLARLITKVFGHHIEQDLRAGPAGIAATPRGLQQLGGDLTAIARMADLANLYDKPIAPETWEALRRQAPRLPADPDAEACRRFLSLMSHPARLGSLLFDLRDVGVLERFIPAMAHARGLLPLNQYHKYTVDEHCLRAVRWATGLLLDMGPLGRAYRRIRRKHVLHLALLLHDLGKGFAEDHCELGRKIARQTARRLGLGPADAKTLAFLVRRHLVMNHLAFRRDTADPRLVLRFARQVGSAELLHMLFVVTAADLAAVGPGVWDGWKAEILTDLYHRTAEYLAGDAPATTIDKHLRGRRQAVRAALGPRQDDPWFLRQLDAMPNSYLNTTDPEHVAADLHLLHAAEPDQTTALGRYLPRTDTVRFTVVTHEQTTPGVFHKLTGALTAMGLQIRSAEINTLADGLVLDRYWTRDPDFAGRPPPERIDEISTALVRSLHAAGDTPMSFPRRWRADAGQPSVSPGSKPRVRADNSTSDRCTILDVFAEDRPNLLYTIARTLFQLDLSIWRAKIGTYGKDVVDVFYVTDQQGHKIEEPSRLDEISGRLLQAIETMAQH